jgi:short-subunit dehydrogenase
MKRVVLVIGGSSGIGMYTAKRFVESGDIVVNMSRRDCEIAGVHNIQIDVADEKYMEKAWDRFIGEYDKLDIMVYSAGFSMASPIEYVDEKDYRYLFEVNLFGYMYFLKKCLPYLKKSGGVTCVVGSTGGIAPIPYDCFYSASKAAVNMLVTCLQYELLPQGVKAICVMPGGTKTHFTFKRKEYSSEIVGEYAIDLERATASLEEIEQNGMSAKKVAKTIYRRCTNVSFASVYASGISNKLIAFLVRFIPQRVLYLIVKSQFGLNGK